MHNSEVLKALIQDYRAAFGSEQGKRVLDHLKEVFFFENGTFSREHDVTVFQEGQRSVVLHIVNLIKDGVLEKLQTHIESSSGE